MEHAGIYAVTVLMFFSGCGAASSGQADDARDERESQSRHVGEGHGHRQEHHHGHRFDEPEAWASRFESPERDDWQRPDVVIAALGLTEESRVADIGSATGYFPVRLARVVPDGRVWGVDIEPTMVRYLNERARREGLENIFSVLGTPDDPLLPEPVDAIIIVNTYHHINDRPAYFRRLLSDLRSGGRLAIVDYRMGEIPHGPPEEMRVPPEQVRAELESAGYGLLSEDLESLPYQFILVFTSAVETS